LRLILGQSKPEEILALADNQEKRCQAHFYVAMAMIVSGEEERARLEFEVCLAQPRQCLEWELARAYRFPSEVQQASEDQVDGRIERLNEEIVLLTREGNYPRALELAIAVNDLVLSRHNERHPHFAASQNNLGALYKLMGDYSAADQILRRGVEIWSDLHDESEPMHAAALNNFGSLCEAMGRYAEAESLYRQALAVWRKGTGEDHPDYGAALNNLAGLFRTVGKYRESQELFQEALQHRRRVLGEKDPEVARTLSNLGELHREMGNHTLAESLCREAVEMLQAALGPTHPDVGTALGNLGVSVRARGRYAEAEHLYRQALSILREKLGDGHLSVASALGNLAGLMSDLGNESAAEPLYQTALQIHRETLGEHHPSLANSLNNLAEFYRERSRYSQAEPLYQQALEICLRSHGETHPDVAVALHNLAAMKQELGDDQAAESLYRQALAILRGAFGEDQHDVADTMNNLALLLVAKGEYAEAIPLLRRSLEIRRAIFGESHPDVASSVHNLALIYQSAGQYEDAKALLEQALGTLGALGEFHRNIAQVMNSLAHVNLAQGLDEQAERLYRQAIDIRRRSVGEDHPDYGHSLEHLAGLLVWKGRPAEALPLLERASRIDDRVIGQVFSVGSERVRQAYLKSMEANQDAFLSLIAKYFSESAEGVSAALGLVLRRKALGAEALAAQRDAILSGRYTHLASRLRELSVLRMQIATVALAGPGPEGLPAHQQLLSAWDAERQGIEAQLALQIPEMNLELKVRSADRYAVAKALPDGALLVEFVRIDIFGFRAVSAPGNPHWDPPRYLAFVLPAGEADVVEMVDLGEAGWIDSLVAAFRIAVSAAPDKRAVMEQNAGVDLRVAIFDKLIPHLRGRTSLILAPDGELSLVPFEALPLEGGRLLIDDYRFSYLSSGRDVLRFGAPAGAEPGEPLVVADPAFNLTAGDPLAAAPLAVAAEPSNGAARQSRELDRGMRFFRLKGTREEGEEVATILGVRPWLESDALEARLKGRRSPRVLHLATHGFFLPNTSWGPTNDLVPAAALRVSGNGVRLMGPGMENPLLRSGLALAGANVWLRGGAVPPEAEDGLLTAEDVSGLDLHSTELVVLSACETGVGEVCIGEGVFGLRRAFVLAGARRLVMSLWKVPDAETRELMVDFHRRVLGGVGVADALRGAQLALRERHPDPYFWAAFILQGDPGAVRT